MTKGEQCQGGFYAAAVRGQVGGDLGSTDGEYQHAESRHVHVQQEHGRQRHVTNGVERSALVVGTSIDPHISAVADWLSSDIQLVRFDVDRYPQDLQFDLHSTSGGSRGYLSTYPELDILDADLLWFRRLGQPGVSPEVDSRYLKFCRGEANHIVESLLLLSRSRHFVNRYLNTRAASSKPFQYDLARQHGLSVPNALMSNRPAALSAFLDTGRSVSKTLSAPLLTDDEREFSFTHVVSAGETPATMELQCAPVQMQHLIDPAFEVRVTSIGDKHIAARIDLLDPTHNLAVRDWRSSYTGIVYKWCDMPDSISRSLTSLLDHLGLEFAASDFIVDRDDNWHFLEANPHGAWLWIEQELGEPRVSRAIAAFIEDRILGRSSWKDLPIV